MKKTYVSPTATVKGFSKAFNILTASDVQGENTKNVMKAIEEQTKGKTTVMSNVHINVQ